MLTAVTKNGKKISLGYDFKKETLLSFRSREEFFCPICGETVVLKLGEKKIFHFAHKRGGTCREFYENETEYHMKGKLQLFHWLKRQKISSKLEYYDPEIQQRPDILCFFNGKKYAIEYQCSILSEEIFKKRTENYIQYGYIPFWILGGQNFQEKHHHSVSLSNFHYLFLQKAKDGPMFIPFFSPDKGTLLILYSIYPYSTRNALYQKSVTPLEQMNLQSLLDPNIAGQFNLFNWITSNEKNKLNWLIYPNSQQKSFLNEIYQYNLNLYLFPPEIGLPLSNNLLMQTPPFVWQAYYYLDVLSRKTEGELVTVKELENSLHKRVKASDILTRNIPQIQNLQPFQAFLEYTQLLVRLGVLSKKERDVYQILRRLKIPKTNKEKEEMMSNFNDNNRKLFFKIN